MTRDEEFIQIIIPCFNGQDYLEETLVSIQNQTKQHLEAVHRTLGLLKSTIHRYLIVNLVYNQCNDFLFMILRVPRAPAQAIKPEATYCLFTS